MARFIRQLALAGIIQAGHAAGVASPTIPYVRDAFEDPAAKACGTAPQRDETTEDNQVLRSPIEGEAKVRCIMTEGTDVKKGEIVCHLDTAALREQLTEQRVATENAREHYAMAKKVLDVAKLNLDMYKNHMYPEYIRHARDRIQIAKNGLERAQDRYEYLKRWHEKERASRLDVIEAAIEVLSAELELKRAEKAHLLLVDEEYNSQVEVLEGDIMKSRDLMREMESNLQRAQEQEQDLERMIEQCKIRAPIDGVVHRLENVKAGSLVRKGQPIIKIVPPQP